MLQSIITSKTRIRLLQRLFLNPASSAYLQKLAQEFSESTNAVRVELNRLEEAGLLRSSWQGKKKLFAANMNHPLVPDLINMVRKTLGLPRLVETIIGNVGDVKEIWLKGKFAEGIDADVIEVVLVGENLNLSYLKSIVEKTENKFNKRIEIDIATKPVDREEVSYLLLWEGSAENQ